MTSHDHMSEVRMGEDRAIGDPPNWAGFDSGQLYEFATRNNDPATADDLAGIFRRSMSLW